MPSDERTMRSIKNPVIGDRFTEMYSVWIHVVEVHELGPIFVVIVYGGNKLRHKVFANQKGWEEWMTYGSIPGSPNRYVDNLPDRVEEYKEWFRESISHENIK